MTPDLGLQIASRLLALVGLLSLVLTGELSPPWGAVAVFSILASALLAVTGRRFGLGRRAWSALNVVVLFFFISDLFFISESLLVASTHFVIFLMINKLFNLRTPQDHLQLYLISFLELLAASTFSSDISFLVAFILYLLTATWALMLLHLVSEGADLSPLHPGARAGITWPFFFNTNLIAMGALFSTVFLFVLLPRIGLGYFYRSHSGLIRMSGFSDQVDLGEIGPVKLDPTVVMRVKPSRPLPAREGIYWRGMIFDYYDGRAWRNSFGSGAVLSREESGVFNLAYRQYPERTITQEIILEPLDTAVLFGAPSPIQVSGRFSSLRVNAMGALSLWAVPATRLDYTITSQLPALTSGDAGARFIEYPAAIQRTNLQLPEASERIQALAREVTASSETILKKVVAIERYLESNYRYTLDVKPPRTGRPIEDFLFDQKAGYCEHYATAMVLLLRSAGIPARLVTGFLPGEWNEFGNYYTVRQSNAHAWVEVWFPESGWYPFDPTPAVPFEPIPVFLGFLSQSFDSLQWRWNRYVIYYSMQDQIRLAREVRDDTIRFRTWVMDRAAVAFSRLRDVLAPILDRPILIGVAFALGVLTLFFLRHRLRRIFNWFSLAGWSGWARRRSGSAVSFYEEVLTLLDRRGYPKPDHLTPQEFVKRLTLLREGDRPLRPPGTPLNRAALTPSLMELTGLYYRVRFAGIPLSSSESRRVDNLLLDLRAGLSLP